MGRAAAFEKCSLVELVKSRFFKLNHLIRTIRFSGTSTVETNQLGPLEAGEMQSTSGTKFKTQIDVYHRQAPAESRRF